MANKPAHVPRKPKKGRWLLIAFIFILIKVLSLVILGYLQPEVSWCDTCPDAPISIHTRFNPK